MLLRSVLWMREPRRSTACVHRFGLFAHLRCRLVRRIDMRLVPASMVIYLLCFLDRSNIVCGSILAGMVAT